MEDEAQPAGPGGQGRLGVGDRAPRARVGRRGRLGRSAGVLEQAQSERLEAYRWIDRETGVVQLPIERAMQLVVEERGGAR